MRAYNVHHSVWQRASYKTPTEKRFRNHEGLLTPLLIPVHNELHAQMPPPPKPSSEQMLGALCFLDELPDSTLGYPPETVEQLAGHFLEQQNNLAKRFGKHLLGQVRFLEQGFVDLSERAA